MPLFKFSMRTGAQKKDAKFHDVLQNKIFHNLISTCVVSQITIDHNRAFAPWHPHTESRVHSLSTYCQAVGLYAYRSLWNTSRYRVSICSRSWKIAAEVKEEDFFCHVTHKTWDVILHDIRKAHENDSESAPDTTPADELIREVQKAMQSPGDRVQQFTEIFCKAFRLKYKRLSQEEQSLLKKLFKKSPLIKQSGMNFRRRPWK